MKIALFARAESTFTASELRFLYSALEQSRAAFVLNGAFAACIREVAGLEVPPEKVYDDFADAQCCDMAVSYGGDGTFLECVRHLGRLGIPVLGINSGRLGFLANVPRTQISEALAEVVSGNFTVEPVAQLQVSGDFPCTPEYPYAFNEFSIQRACPSMIAVEAYVNGQMVATYWGDGVLLSTPSGSTAYSLSVGGPVIDPRCGCFVLSPIAPHNLTMRPVVIPDDSTITFRVSTREGDVYAVLDNQSYKVGNAACFTVRKAENSVFLVKLQNISFYQTLRNKMLWGFDPREVNGE